MSNTESFTFRMPSDVKQEIEKRTAGISRKRSELVVQLLREALGLEGEVPASVFTKVADEASNASKEVLRLSQKMIEIVKTQDSILQRLSALEKLQVAVNSTGNNIDSVYEPGLNLLLEGISEDLNTFKSSEDDDIPSNSQKMNSSELLKILKRELPSESWNSQKLKEYRKGKKSLAWNEVGQCKFKYANEKDSGASLKMPQHLFWVIYPNLKID